MTTQHAAIETFINSRNQEDATPLWTIPWSPASTVIAEWWNAQLCLLNPDAMDLPGSRKLQDALDSRGIRWRIDR